MLPCHQKVRPDGKLKPFYLSMLSPKLQNSFDKNLSHFTSQNMGVASLPSPQSVSLFVLVCDFGVLKGLLTFTKLTN